jgi:hypothetical protein
MLAPSLPESPRQLNESEAKLDNDESKLFLTKVVDEAISVTNSNSHEDLLSLLQLQDVKPPTTKAFQSPVSTATNRQANRS